MPTQHRNHNPRAQLPKQCMLHIAFERTSRIGSTQHQLIVLSVAGCRVNSRLELPCQEANILEGLLKRRSGAAIVHTPVHFGTPITYKVAQMLRSAKLGQRQPANRGPNTRSGSRTSRARHLQPSHPAATAANGNGNGSGTAHHSHIAATPSRLGFGSLLWLNTELRFALA